MSMKNFLNRISAVCAGGLFLMCLESNGQISTTVDIQGKDVPRPITTAVPFLRISPDARSGALGDAGIAISPDANSVYWNFSKLPFAKQKSAVAVTYTPWLKELVNDVFLAQVAGYTQIDELQTIGGSLRYFSLGDIEFRN